MIVVRILEFSSSMTKCIGYIRVSTDEQATGGHSLGAQEAKIRAYCDLYEITLVRIEVDAGASAKSLQRPALQRALSSLKRGEAEALVVVKLDRLTRSTKDLAVLLDEFQDERRALLSVGEQLDTRSAAGRLVLRLLTSVAEWEREAIGERTATALAHLASQGKRVSGAIPWGYSLADDGETLMERADEQAVIVEARALRAAGLSLRAISSTLAVSGLRARSGKPFAPSAIAAMLDGQTEVAA